MRTVASIRRLVEWLLDDDVEATSEELFWLAVMGTSAGFIFAWLLDQIL